MVSGGIVALRESTARDQSPFDIHMNLLLPLSTCWLEAIPFGSLSQPGIETIEGPVRTA